jgi:hypothetical protein
VNKCQRTSQTQGQGAADIREGVEQSFPGIFGAIHVSLLKKTGEFNKQTVKHILRVIPIQASGTKQCPGTFVMKSAISLHATHIENGFGGYPFGVIQSRMTLVKLFVSSDFALLVAFWI